MLEYLTGLDKQLLLAVNGSGSLFADNMAVCLTTAQTWIPLYVALLYLTIRNNENMQKIFLVIASAALCVLLTGTVDDLIVKPWVARPRPTHDLEIGQLVRVVGGYRGGPYGFFSAHAANTFSIAVLFSLIVRRGVFTVAMLGWSLVNCWTRMYLGVHYPGDILAGILWGTAVALAVFCVYRRICLALSLKRKGFISSKYTETGYLHSDIDIVLLTLALTIFYCIARSLTVL